MSLRTFAPPHPRTPAPPHPPVLVFAPGAGAGQDHPWMRKVAEELAQRGIRVVTFDFPYKQEGRKVPDRGPMLEEAFAAAWREAVAGHSGAMFAGGKSMGGRIASQVAARSGFDPAPDGLVLLGYPLHPPGKPGQRRDRHLPDVAAPMLFLHGTRDPFGSPDEMTELVARLPGARLEVIDGGDHSLVAPKTQDPNSLHRAIASAAAFMVSLSPKP